MFHADRALRHSAFGLHWSLVIGHLSFALILALLISGCTSHDRPHAHLPPSKYAPLPAKNFPAFMKGTILEAAEVENKDPYLVSGYGLVVNLANTGDNRGVPQAVVGAILDEMARRGLGSSDERLKPYKPEAMVQDPQTAIVEVYAWLPPGGRAGQRIDVFVQAERSSQSKSLA